MIGNTISRDDVTAVVVTRGDVPENIGKITRRLYYGAGIPNIYIWDNTIEPNMGVYGRYAALEKVDTRAVFVQDDDCLLEVEAIHALIDAYDPGRIVVNMPEGRWPDYPDSCLVGWGAVYDRVLPDRAFNRFAFSSHANGMIAFGSDGVDQSFFDRTCDVVFTTLTPHTKHDLGFQHLPGAEDPARAMFLQPGHGEERARMLDLARKVRDAH
jgi:hypothetical protein